MNICFIGDRVGKVHFNRCEIFKKYLPHDFTFVSTKDDRPKFHKFDAVYYASIASYLTYKVDHPNLFGSATSWKCVTDKQSRKVTKYFGQFKKVSANNLRLWEKLKYYREDIQYLPNGVEVDFFTPQKKDFDPDNISVGWVGNRNRSEKNFKTVLNVQTRTKKCIKYQMLITEKSTPMKRMLGPSEMRDFYRKLDFFWVSSTHEGTPNPALEAASCGTPLVATKVGNMPELITEGKNGFFVECNADSMVTVLNNLRHIKPEDYQKMRQEIRSTICDNWSWKKSCFGFRKFFEGGK